MKRPLKRPHSSVPGPRPQSPAQPQRAAARLAFTLLELLIAIAIIAILASLILTVAGAASQRARQAQVASDIQSLAAGIAAFKQRFGVEPPSSVTLYEQGTSIAPSGTGWANDPRSMGLIRQIWPQFDFNYGNETAFANAVDINGNGTATDTITITGIECVVFFLGGMPTLNSPNAAGGAPMGFSSNPVDPFNRSGSNRLSFTEFDKSRLILYTPAGGTQHTMNAYVDTYSGQTQPYLYLSSYGGQGYNIGELVGAPANAANAPGGTFIDVYRQGPQGYWFPTRTTPVSQPESSQSVSTTPNSATASPPWNPNSYQIISPGGDGLYGVGGEYETANGASLLTMYPGAAAPAPPTQNVDRTGERDNITNFSSGILAP